MNEHDLANLEFLLTASAEVLKEWYEVVEEDDIEYAEELLAAYGKEYGVGVSIH